ncbi:DUF6221 family protein [Streptomyces sp. NPDC002644]
MTHDLVQWLRTQLDADEQTARQATEGPWIAEVSGETGHCVIPADAQSAREFVAKTQLYAAAFDAEHIARYNPERALREVDIKRRLLALHPRGMNPAVGADPDDRATWLPVCDTCQVEAARPGDWPCEHLRLLAMPYADRPGYRKEWRPGDRTA